ncbi:PREDICTED: uncharacterized protein LOC105559099 [Vollenhovia emeryi]|uniref:uncharacterized protein LOC105559099 n=1 Tax=Vollenhovia emeryi TaxID=411798 RepID=UPI0005F38B7E|nr:PREDICTED: uncharacterized protein LOC105559099 [Vollenhovia emeryi]
MGIYIRPSLTRAELEDRLDELERQVRGLLPGPVIIAGDFNAASTLWGSRRQNAKGAEVVAWANRLGLHLENKGNASTCVRPQGESIVDLTWTSPGATRMIDSWRVAEDLEILSDHLPIIFELTLPDGDGASGDVHQRPPRWAVRKLDPDRLRASLTAETWLEEEPGSAEEQALWIRAAMTRACDAAMPRAAFKPRKEVYWWSEEVALLRRAVVRARRQLQRARRRRDSSQEAVDCLLEEYRAERKALKLTIKRAKESAWEELIATLNEDPWGRPYKLVLNKLSKGAPPTVEAIDLQFLGEVVRTLFPENADTVARTGETPDGRHPEEEEENIYVTNLELNRAAKKLKAGKAPGPDGIPRRGC